MNSWKRLLLIGVIAYCFFLVASFPANVAYSWFANKSAPVQLANIEGSIWSGTAAQVRAPDGVTLQGLAWQISPWRLLTGRIYADVQLNDPHYAGSGNIAIGLGQSLRLQDAKGTLPATLLRSVRGLEFLGLEGIIAYNLENLIVDEEGVKTATGNLNLQQGRLNSPVPAEIGDLQFDIKPQGQNVEISFRDIKSPFKINGKITLLTARRFDYNATLTPTPTSDPALISMLRSLTRPGRSGEYHFEYKGVY